MDLNNETENDGNYLFILGQLFFATMSWLNLYKRNKRMPPECRPPVLSLNLFAANDLARVLRCSLDNLAGTLQELYGVNMSEHGVNQDRDPTISAQYRSAKQRMRYRVYIFDGVAMRNERRKLWKIDTGVDNSTCGNRKGELFVLSMSNELYVGMPHKHSFFMGGIPVQTAGTVEFGKGKLVAIKNDSGHYQPVDLSLVKALQYFRIHGMNINDVKVSTVRFKNNRGAGDASTTGAEFMRSHGNWEAIFKKAPHQMFRK
ncbi:hypothetical protein [Planctomycetes bacterium CA13]